MHALLSPSRSHGTRMHRRGSVAQFVLRHGQNLRRSLRRGRQSVHRHPPARQRIRGRRRYLPLQGLHRQPIPVLLDHSAGWQAQLRRWQLSRTALHRNAGRHSVQSAAFGRRCRPLCGRGQFGPWEELARSACAEHPRHAHPLCVWGH